MKRTHPKSRIEVWSGNYINAFLERRIKDIGAKIIQIEPGSKVGTYVVEVIGRLDLDDF